MRALKVTHECGEDPTEHFQQLKLELSLFGKHHLGNNELLSMRTLDQCDTFLCESRQQRLNHRLGKQILVNIIDRTRG